MSKKLIEQLKRARSEGVDMGLITHDYLTVIAEDNVLKDYIDEEKLGTVLHELEMERARVWAEIVISGEGKKKRTDEAADLLVGHVERIRRERGMDEWPLT